MLVTGKIAIVLSFLSLLIGWHISVQTKQSAIEIYSELDKVEKETQELVLNTMRLKKEIESLSND